MATVHDGSSNRSILFVLASGNFAQLGARFLIGVFVPLIILEFSVSKSQIGLVLTGMYATYALIQFPSGILSDTFSEKAIILVGLIASIISTILIAVSPNFPLFGLAIICFGAGTGLYFSPASSLVSKVFDEHGGPLAVMTSSGSLAGLVFPAVGGVIGVYLGWRIGFLTSLAIIVPALIATWWVLPATHDRNRLLSDLDLHLHVLSRPGVLYTIVLAIVLSFSFQSFASFLPTFFVEYQGLNTDLAGILFGVVLGLSSIAQPIAGRLSDFTSRDFAIGLSLTLMLVGLTVFLLSTSIIELVIGAITLGLGISWPGPVQARIMDQLDVSERGSGYGLVRTTYTLIASLGSVVIGTVVDLSGWSTAISVILLMFVFCLVIIGINRAFTLEL